VVKIEIKIGQINAHDPEIQKILGPNQQLQPAGRFTRHHPPMTVGDSSFSSILSQPDDFP
jgi:hypothetical protein